ncbi:hypothetical protein LH506_08030 [Lapidilactobacillus dextrinicus]|nr:hypothetical protein [Lapidilactobacillus dextrinicus]QFG47365.1 hypothetical protein LH506_08030 [Lapidilactobacillus dextrinicus]
MVSETWAFLNSNFGSNIVAPLIIWCVGGLAAFLFTKHYADSIRLAHGFKQHGISRISTLAPSRREMRRIFEHASKIKIIYVAGHNFIQNSEYFDDAVAKNENVEIQYVFAKDDQKSGADAFIRRIQDMEKRAGIRDLNTDINDDVHLAEKVLKNYQDKLPNLKYQQFTNEYRMPVIIAETDLEKNLDEEQYKTRKIKVEAWLTVTMPPYKSKQNILVYGREDITADELDRVQESGADSDELNLVRMCELHFQSVWENCQEHASNE